MANRASIKQLPFNVQAKLRSGVTLTSVAQCVEELVLNAIDSKATCIAVRIDLEIVRIQVVDNGIGISKADMKMIGKRYATSKCSSLDDLNLNLCHYGFRGEALASTIDISGIVEITSLLKGTSDTFLKLFIYGNERPVVKCSEKRPSFGTTVTIQDFLYNMPVRRKLIKQSIEIEIIRSRLEAIALIHPEISISLRNDKNKSNILYTHKNSNILDTFIHIFGKQHYENMSEIFFELDKFKISGYICTQPFQNKSLQFLYINKRLILNTKIHNFLNDLLNRSSIIRNKVLSNNLYSSGKISASPPKGIRYYGIFILNIECPFNEYDICIDPQKTLVEFKDWDKILELIEEMMIKFTQAEEITLSLDERFRKSKNYLEEDSHFESPLPHKSFDILKAFINPKATINNASDLKIKKRISTTDMNAVHGLPALRAKSHQVEKQPIINEQSQNNDTTNIFEDVKQIECYNENDKKEIDEISSISHLKKICANNKSSSISNLKRLCNDKNNKIKRVCNMVKANNSIEKSVKEDNYISSIQDFKKVYNELHCKKDFVTPSNLKRLCDDKNNKTNRVCNMVKANNSFEKSVKEDNYISSIQDFKKVYNELHGKKDFVTPSNNIIPQITPIKQKRCNNFENNLNKKIETKDMAAKLTLSQKLKQKESNVNFIKSLQTFKYEKRNFNQQSSLKLGNSNASQQSLNLGNSNVNQQLLKSDVVINQIENVKNNQITNTDIDDIEICEDNFHLNPIFLKGSQTIFEPCDIENDEHNSLDYLNDFLQPQISSEPHQNLFLEPNILSEPQRAFLQPQISSEPHQNLFLEPKILSEPQGAFLQPQISSEPPQNLFLEPKILSKPQRAFLEPQISTEHPQNTFLQPHISNEQIEKTYIPNEQPQNTFLETHISKHHPEKDTFDANIGNDYIYQIRQNLLEQTLTPCEENSSQELKNNCVNHSKQTRYNVEYINQCNKQQNGQNELKNISQNRISDVRHLTTNSNLNKTTECKVSKNTNDSFAENSLFHISKNANETVAEKSQISKNTKDKISENNHISKNTNSTISEKSHISKNTNYTISENSHISKNTNPENSHIAKKSHNYKNTNDTVAVNSQCHQIYKSTNDTNSKFPWKPITLECGKTIYMNMRTGNTCFNPPISEASDEWSASQPMGCPLFKIKITQDFDSMGNNTNDGLPRDFTLSHGFSKFLPNKRKSNEFTTFSNKSKKLATTELNKNSQPLVNNTDHNFERNTSKNITSVHFQIEPKKHNIIGASANDGEIGASASDNKVTQLSINNQEIVLTNDNENIESNISNKVPELLNNITEEFLELSTHNNQKTNLPHSTNTGEVDLSNYINRKLIEPFNSLNNKQVSLSNCKNSKVIEPSNCINTSLIEPSSYKNSKEVDSSNSTNSKMVELNNCQNSKRIEQSNFRNSSIIEQSNCITNKEIDLSNSINSKMAEPNISKIIKEIELSNFKNSILIEPSNCITNKEIDLSNSINNKMVAPSNCINSKEVDLSRNSQGIKMSSSIESNFTSTDNTPSTIETAMNIFLNENSDLEDICTKWNTSIQESSGISARLSTEFEDFAMDSEVLATHIVEQGKIPTSIKCYEIVNPYKLDKDMLQHCKVLGQVDNKFIVISLTYASSSLSNKRPSLPYNLILLVDQHAADERVQLEKVLSENYDSKYIKKSFLKPPVEFKFRREEIRLMKAYRNAFCDLGLEFTMINDEDVLFHTMPRFLLPNEPNERYSRRCKTAKLIIEATVKELCHDIQTLGGLTTDNQSKRPLPKPYLHILNTIACKSAIKFGNPLSMKKCSNLIKSLSQCQLPFQCAHGRPSIIPIVDLNYLDNNPKVSKQPNLRNLKINI